MARILVVGAGAIGGLLASHLHVAGHQVTATARPATIAAMEGFSISGCTEFHDGSFLDHYTPEPDGEFDLAFVTTKATATAAAAQVAAKHAPLVVSIQNGFGNGTKLVAATGQAAASAVGTTSHGVTRRRPGDLVHAGVGLTHIGPATPGHEDAARAAYSLLMDAGWSPQWHDDMASPVWTKGVVNAGLNPVAALAGVPNGGVASEPLLWQRCEGLLAEGAALARAAGIHLPADLSDLLKQTLVATKTNRCSMVQDVDGKRPTEIEQITGYLIRWGRRLGYPMPLNDAAYRDVKQLEVSYLGEAAALELTKQEVRWDLARY